LVRAVGPSGCDRLPRPRGDQYERAVGASTGTKQKLPSVQPVQHPSSRAQHCGGCDRVSGGAIGDEMSDREEPIDALLGASHLAGQFFVAALIAERG
jgi:hypothetical protein